MLIRLLGRISQMTAILRILLLLCISSTTLSAQEARQIEAPEEVATRYMTAFFHGELEVAASLLGPGILDPLKSTLKHQLDTAPSRDRSAFLEQLGYASVEEFVKTPPKEIFIRMTRLNGIASPAFAERAKKATIAVDRTEEIAPERRRVKIRIHIPGADSRISLKVGLI